MSKLALVFGGGLALLLGITVVERINTPSEKDFVSVPLPDGISANQVVVSGLLDCPQSGTQTRQVIDQLTAAQIPYQHITNFSFSAADDWAGIQRLNEVLKRGAPVVFVNGKVKAQPTPQEVIAEYRKARR